MWQDIRNHPSALAIAIALHVLAAVMVLVTFDFSAPTVGTAQPQPTIVEAVAISGADYDAALQRIEDEKRREREARLAAERKQREAEERKRREEQLRQQRAAEEKARQEAARREAEAKRQREAAEKARQEKLQREAEAKRAAELKRQQELAAQREAERKAEQERLASQLAAEEAALREAERQRAEAEARARLNAQLASVRDEYMAAIVARIQGNWERPLGSPNNQRARIYVRQGPGGLIIEAKMLRCEGTEAFCRSVLDAVWRSDPLPAPPREEVFDDELEIEFDPDRP
jgi:colicin import membrane protein